MKRTIFLFFLLPGVLSAQNFHFSGRFGAAGYQGDLREKTVTLQQSRIFGSIGARYDLSEHITARSYLSLGSLKADDSKSGKQLMLDRNLSFRTKIWEWEAGMQYSLFSLNNKWWTPYAFAGIGLYHFNSYTYDQSGNKVYLQPLSTEGQGIVNGIKPYKKTQFCLPLGFGAERALGEDVRVGVEMGYRKLFTDYLDDVSGVYVDENVLLTAKGPKSAELAYRGDELGSSFYPPAGTPRGGAKYKDGYFFAGITLTVRYWFDKYKKIAGLPAYKKEKRVGCPATRQY